jgi:hypothetical protein
VFAQQGSYKGCPCILKFAQVLSSEESIHCLGVHGMKRQFTPLFRASVWLLALVAAMGAQADELPVRKAGLWEIKMSGGAGASTRQCITSAVEKEMWEMAISGGMDCSKMDIRKTASGYVIDAACKIGEMMSVTSRTEFTGDFNSAYTMKQTGRVETKGHGPQDTSVAIQAKWLGACPPDWKPGDTELPGGSKINLSSSAKIPASGKPKGPSPK